LTQLYINCIRFKIVHIVICSLGMLCTSAVFAQQTGGAIKGKVTDDKSNVLPSGTVYLLKAIDSSIVKLALTNDLGVFEFDNLKQGVYLISISVIGYQKTILQPITVQAGGNIDLGIVTLKKRSDLKELEVTAKNNYVDIKPGKIVLNVNKSILSTGNTVLDILSTAPGVQVNNNGSITLKGKDVIITINGKQVYLSPDALAELLRNTPGSMVTQIELISTPNANYSAEGSGGVINIKLQHNKTEGISGSANAGYGITDINKQYGTRTKWSSGFNVDYNNKNISLFGGFTHTNSIAQRLSVTDRAVYNPSLKQISTDYLNDLNERGNNLKLGMDYNINPKQVIGFLANGVFSNYDYTKNTNTTTNVNNTPDSMFVSRSLTTRRLLTYIINLNYKGSLGNLGELSADADYSVFDRQPYETIYTDKYVLHPSIILLKTMPPSYIQNIFPTLYHIYTFNATDDIKLSKNSAIMATAKISYVTNDNNANFGNVVNYTYQPDPYFSGQYNYNEQINALGLTYSTFLNTKTNIELGLRAEQTINNGLATSITGVQTKSTNNYTDLFPSLQLTSNINENNQLSFSYGRRIKRPSYTDLNPFVNYQDQYNYFAGNPGLKPQYANSIEITNTYKQKSSITLSASLINNYVFITFLPGNIVAQKVNFGKNNSYGLQLNQVVDVTNWWNANLNLEAYYDYFNNSLNGAVFDINTRYVTLNIHQQFSFLKQYKAELLTLYESPKYEGFYHYDGRYKINAGLSKSILNKKGSIQFQVADIFNSYYNNYNTNYQGLNYTGHLQNSFRTYQLNLTYSFSSRGAKAERAHKLGSTDEQSRAGGGG
jgi:iron complex outermembrane receptor protein